MHKMKATKFKKVDYTHSFVDIYIFKNFGNSCKNHYKVYPKNNSSVERKKELTRVSYFFHCLWINEDYVMIIIVTYLIGQ